MRASKEGVEGVYIMGHTSEQRLRARTHTLSREHRGMNQPFVANFYLMLFFTVSCIILLQLVIAVLMDQFTQVSLSLPPPFSLWIGVIGGGGQE